jgi:hypothetical protein
MLADGVMVAELDDPDEDAVVDALREVTHR